MTSLNPYMGGCTNVDPVGLGRGHDSPALEMTLFSS